MLVAPQTSKLITAGAVTSGGTSGTTVTSGSANVKGSWTTLLDPIPSNFHALHLFLDTPSATRNSVDIAIGNAGGGSERIIISDYWFAQRVSACGHHVRYPIGGPPGGSLRARLQTTSASATLGVTCYLESGSLAWSPRPMVRAKGYGVALSGVTQGQNVDPGGTAHTKGAYTEIVAATDYPITAWYLHVGLTQGVTTPTYPANYNWLIDVAVGGAGSEIVIVPDILMGADTAGDFIQSPVIGPFFVPIPAGSRIAVRAQASVISDATYRKFDATIMGLR